MTAAVTEMPHCLDPETLAAFVDGRLNAAQRQEAMKHLAECAECRDNVLLSTEIVAAERRGQNVSPGWFGWKTMVPLAAAASIAVLVGIPTVREQVFGRGPMREAVELAATVEERPSEARLSLDVPYQKAKRRMRGGGQVGDVITRHAADEATARAAKKPTVDNLRAAGLTLMYAGKHGEAVTELERAVATDPHPSAALLNDLSAAYFGSGDYPRALLNAERAWKIEQTPTAAWNRAVALEFAGNRNAEAIAAWRQYLQMDPSSPWTDEARSRLRDLEEAR